MLNASLNMLLTIVDRGKGDGVAQLLQQEGVLAHFIALGNGTADQGLLSLLGLKDTAKDVVFSFMERSTAVKALRKLSYALDIDLPGRGIAFILPLSSVGGSQTKQYLTGQNAPEPQTEEGKPMYNGQPETPSHDLIITIVNRGFTDLVMEAALPAGARGGTVLHARGAGSRDAAQFLGITIQPEKEMVLILTPHDKKVPIMQAITRGAGLNSEGKGIVFSLPVTDVMGVARMMEEQTEQ
ncbi:MAG: P-II family nitrogen regulator [Clostridia bacterium]|nr:P-II family nitrogen regulator [Clostridia bacterium]